MGLCFVGQPILVECRPNLRAHRGKLLCGGERGAEVHAASFLRQRRIVLDLALFRKPAERDRILAHEIGHFVWWRAGIRLRSRYESMIIAELDDSVPGEMGWSAESRKLALLSEHRLQRTRPYREYLCESFCDTFAAELLGLTSHEEITLPAFAKRLRSQWLGALLAGGSLNI